MNEEEIFQKLKQSRGLEYLNPSISDLNSVRFNPFTLRNMEEVIFMIDTHKKFKSDILIFTDYDVDGILGGWILFDYLYGDGMNVNMKISDRSLGYGFSKKEVQEIISDNYDLVITVDCGISENENIETLQNSNIDVIVTDHHENNNPPNCDFINPKVGGKYFDRNLSGAGVAYKLVCALEGEKVDKYLDVVSIANIADFVPLQGENRILTKLGLQKINKKPYYPIKKMLEEFGIDKLDENDVAFKVAPAINAVNRLGYSTIPFEILTGTDIKKNTKKMIKKNDKRKKEVRKAIKKLEFDTDKNIIVAKGDINRGYTGLIASKLKDKYKRPAVVVNKNNKGSARSMSPLNIYELLNKKREFFQTVGGHEFASGFSLKKGRYDELKAFLYSKTRGLKYTLRKEDLVLEDLNSINEKLINKLEILKPFGAGNPKPYFKLENVKFDDYKTTRTGEHLQLEINGKRGIWFDYNKNLELRNNLDVFFEVQKDDYRGEGVQLIVREVLTS